MSTRYTRLLPPFSSAAIVRGLSPHSAADTKTAIMSAGKSGVDAYVIKPFSVSTVVEKIKEAIEKRETL